VSTRLDRRGFLRLGLSAAAASALPGCGSGGFDERYTEQDAARLVEQKRAEKARSGSGPFGPQVYRGYRGLAELPWFELDADGSLRCVAEDVPKGIDMHSHLGMALLTAPELNLQARTPRVRHMLDCDGPDPGCELDLDVYANANFSASDLNALRRLAVAQFSIGSSAAATHTIPNLLAEMDAMRVERAMILPIAFGLPFGDDLTETWTAAIRAAGLEGRLLPGASVFPRDPEAVAKLRRYAADGARAVKLHPNAQRYYPDAPEAMPIYQACGELGLPVCLHAGRAGIEPERVHRYMLPRHYEPMLRRFPEVDFVFLHSGARDMAGMLPLAERYKNVWLGIHGQGVSALAEILERVGPDRLLFGTDWPFYTLSMSLAKVLIVTEGRPGARRAILRGNALRLLGQTEEPA
jgi:predicted TIM-barrel fold metal-dependent hydrolase